MSLGLALANKLEFVFVDNSGKTSRVGFWVDSSVSTIEDDAVLDLIAAVDAISDVYIRSVKLKMYAVESAPAAPAASPFDHGEEKAMLVFSSVGGDFRTMAPAPLETILTADHETVDAADASVIALVNYVKANCVTANGQTIQALRAGYRMQPKSIELMTT